MSSKAGKDQVLSGVDLFRDLSPAELTRLERLGRRRHYAPGDTIVQQGQSGIALFVVLSGQVRVSRKGADGREQALRTIGPGGAFGEMALLSNLPRSATVAAGDGEVECLALHRLDFLEELRRYPEVAIRLLETLSRRLQDAERRG
jgi:CRP/FNR family cyclic AMP-dependent transcriptional regulator